MFVGADVSGNMASGNHKYMALAACTTRFVDDMTKMIERRGSDLVSRKQAMRNFILSETKMYGQECIVFCMRMERKATFERLKLKLEPGKRPNPALKKIMRKYHYLHLKSVRGRLDKFLNGHGYALASLAVECDSDCKGFAADIGLRPAEPGHAYLVADAVAWANNRGMEPEGVVEVDSADQVTRQLKGLKTAIPT